MVIPDALGKKFCEIMEFPNVPWSVVDEVAVSDPNILRPIKGVCFEELFHIVTSKFMPNLKFSTGPGDSDVDVFLNDIRLQLKTHDKGSTVADRAVGVALHKTHGREERPYNLYDTRNPTFDFLVVLHPADGILIVPYKEIPSNQTWRGYLADPAVFEWNSPWKNRWDLLGFPELKGKSLESRTPPATSSLPKLSDETFLEDFQIIETLSKPEYFRAAVMGLKGNIKEFWLIDLLRKKGYSITDPTEAYAKYDFKVTNRSKITFKVQVKGTSKNMCNIDNETIGVEVMGTHGRFPHRGYKKSYFDFLAVVISECQIGNNYPIEKGTPHFLFIPMSDLPLHYLIGNGSDKVESGYGNKKWNQPGYADVLYPNIKLKMKYDKEMQRVLVLPDLRSYGMHKGMQIISPRSPFRTAGPYIIDQIPEVFK